MQLTWSPDGKRIAYSSYDSSGVNGMKFVDLATLETAVDRRDFGLTWNQVLEAGGVLVSNDVKIEIEAQVKEAADRQAA